MRYRRLLAAYGQKYFMICTVQSFDEEVTVRDLGRTGHVDTWRRMRAHTDARDSAAPDEIWLTTHPPVYTLGQSAKTCHLLAAAGIPVVHCDRGGQVTYHGPGQAIAYLLVDLRRRSLSVRKLVTLIEDAVIALLADEGITGERRAKMPGIYVRGAKIAALGLRVRRGCSYHGVSLNVDCDLAPFAGIDPCGYPGLQVTSLRELGAGIRAQGAAVKLGGLLAARISSAGR